MNLSNKSPILNFQRGITPIRCLSITPVKINQIILKSRRTIWWKQFVKILFGFWDIAITRKKGCGEITPIRIIARSHRVSFEPPLLYNIIGQKIHSICCKTKKHLGSRRETDKALLKWKRNIDKTITIKTKE